MNYDDKVIDQPKRERSSWKQEPWDSRRVNCCRSRKRYGDKYKDHRRNGRSIKD